MKSRLTMRRWMARIGLLTLMIGLLTSLLAGPPAAQAASAGTIAIWGNNDDGQLNAPAGLNNLTAISAKYFHTLALKSDGSVAAWGDNTYGQLDIPTSLANVKAVAAGLGHSLALKGDGTVVGWGGTGIINRGQATPPAGLDNVVAISAGVAHSMALKSDGTVRVWGDNNSGQGNIPADVTNVVAIASGNLHNLALKSDGTVRAWGDNSTGQLNIPPGLTNVVAIAAGEYHNLALKGDGSVVAWGASSLGRTTVPDGLDHVIAIAAGGIFNLALKGDGTVVAWGDNSAGQLNLPAGLANVVAISAGSSHGVALKSDSALVSGFGQNVTGQLNIPARLYNVKSVGQSAFNSMAVKSDGTVVAWGATGGTDQGQNNLPAGLNNVVASDGGYYHNYALRSDGTVAGWGNNTFGQLNFPGGLSNVKAISSGLYQGEALKSDGTVAVWGLNNFGQLDIPAGLTNIRAIAAGSQFMLALKGDGTVVGWGDGSFGATTPPPGLDHVVAISAGGVHSLALKSDGTVQAWGLNRNGQLNVPSGLTNVVAIAAGAEHSLALTADGKLVAWGVDAGGSTTVPPSLSNVVGMASRSGSTLVLYGAGTIDLTPPSTSATTSPAAPNGTNDWFTSNVVVSLSASDGAGSGVKSIRYSASGAQPIAATTVNGASASLTISADGTTTISYAATDLSDNVEATRTLTIKLDKTLPTITASARLASGRTWAANRWINQNVIVSFSCSDATSGIAAGACPAPITVSDEGTTPSVTGTVSDQAGNSRSVSFGPILIDKIAPTVSITPSRAPDRDGWYNAPVSFSFSGVDAGGAGGVTCSAAKTYSAPDSATASISGTCGDIAENVGSATATFKYDAGAPTIALDSRTAANAAGWNNSAVTISWTCSDAISGATSAGVSQTISAEGANQSATGSCADTAGNSVSNTQAGVNIDTTAPTISAATTAAPNADGWYKNDVSVHFTCGDTLSGVASCPDDQTLSGEGAAVSSTAQSASDVAGNASAPSNVVTVKIDKTAPAVIVTGVTSGAIYPLGSVPAAGCSTTDPLSGVATVATLSITGGNADGTGSYTASCSGASDIAGNSGSASLTYTVGYRWSGFFQPVDNLPTVNTVKAGQAIPVKFSLGGNYGLNIFAAGYPKVQVLSCSSGVPTDEIEQTVTAGGSSLTYDAASGQYNYVWKTDKAWAGSCRQLIVRLVDGTDHTALFLFR